MPRASASSTRRHRLIRVSERYGEGAGGCSALVS
jgi:hypothetical protein